jgi:hypothetical protein
MLITVMSTPPLITGSRACGLAYGDAQAGGMSERVIEFCRARNARFIAQGKIRY